MFVLVGKIFAPLAYPLGMAAGLWVLAALCAWRHRPAAARRLTVAGIFLVLYFSQPWVADGLVRSLEDDYPILKAQQHPAADAIVVLGGATGAPIPPRVEVDVADGFDRLLYGIRLYRAGKAPHLILSGGAMASITGSSVTEAQRLRQLALESGVPDEAMILEEQSRTTRENAVYTSRILEQRGWQRVLLVTSARHMRRAVGVFETVGVEVIAAPTDVLAVERPLGIVRFLPKADALDRSHQAIKEYVGYFVYGLRGWL